METSIETPSSFNQARGQLLNEFPSEGVEGINKARANEYLRQQGVDVKKHIVFDSVELPRVRKIVGNTRLYGNTS